MIKQLFKLSMASLVVGFVLAGCGGSGGGAGTGASAQPTLQFFNSVPDSTALDFALNGNVTAPKLAYGTGSTNYISINAATDDVTITEHGQTQSYWDDADQFSNGSDYIEVAVGKEGYGTELEKRPQLVYTTIDRTVPNGTQSRLIVVHAFNRATGTATGAIDFANPGQNPAPWAISGLAFGTEQTITLPAGSEDIQARNTGTQLVFVEKTFNLVAGHVYLCLVTGEEGATGATAPNMILIDLKTKST